MGVGDGKPGQERERWKEIASRTIARTAGVHGRQQAPPKALRLLESVTQFPKPRLGGGVVITAERRAGGSGRGELVR